MTHYQQAKEANLAQLKTLTLILLNDQSGADGVRSALWEREVEAVAVLLELLWENPDNFAGQNAAYELGEIAYRQKFQQDPRIVPGLLEAFTKLENIKRTDRLWSVMAGLSKCVRFVPKPEAQVAAEKALNIYTGNRDFYFGTFDYSLAVYLVNQGWKKTLALRDWLAQKPDPEGLLEEFDEFLEEQTHVDPGYEPGDLTCAAQAEAELAAKQASNLA